MCFGFEGVLSSCLCYFFYHQLILRLPASNFEKHNISRALGHNGVIVAELGTINGGPFVGWDLNRQLDFRDTPKIFKWVKILGVNLEFLCGF